MNEKKKGGGAEPKMGYCPFESEAGRAGAGRALGCAGLAASKRGARAERMAGKRGALGARATQALGARPGCTWARRLGCGLCTWCTQLVLIQV